MPHPSEVELLEHLVGFDTVSSRSNLDLVAFVRHHLAALGVAATTIPDATGRKANLVASIGPADRPGYVLSGHTDVVPVEGQEWSRDPFTLARRDGRLYGRGTTDMKGFLACMLAEVPRMLAAPLAHPIHLVFSYDEEVGCLGVGGIVDHLAAAAAPPIACFVGEPTGMGVVDGHKGSAGLLTSVAGRSCHSSRPDLGVNAIFAAAEIVGELRRRAEALRAAPDPGSPFAVPYTTISVGVIGGGTARNAVPGDCDLQWDIRATRPGVVEAVIRELAGFVEAAVLPPMRAVEPAAAVETRMAYDVPPLVPDAGSVAETLAKRFAGSNDVRTVNYGSEAGIFQAAGMPTVLCGPGYDTEAHVTDEWIAEEQLARCRAFIGRLVEHARGA